MGNSGLAVSKVIAKVAGVGLDADCIAFLHDCFRQFNVHVVAMNGNPVELFHKQKFEACVLRLYDPDVEEILSTVRGSASNRRMVIYGIARNTQEALRHSSYGINVVLDEPLERQSVLKAVRATHLLVVHELRRYVRIPVVTEVSIDTGARSLTAITMEVSAGGMSVRCQSPLPSVETVRIAFTLPGTKKIALRAHVCWSRPNEHSYGFRFDATDDARVNIRNWIDQYLEIM